MPRAAPSWAWDNPRAARNAAIRWPNLGAGLVAGVVVEAEEVAVEVEVDATPVIMQQAEVEVEVELQRFILITIHNLE